MGFFALAMGQTDSLVSITISCCFLKKIKKSLFVAVYNLIKSLLRYVHASETSVGAVKVD